jgi:hypothetical protein
MYGKKRAQVTRNCNKSEEKQRAEECHNKLRTITNIYIYMCVCVCACVKICVFLSTSIRTGIAGMASMGALGSNTLGKPQARTWANALFSAVTISCVRSETQPCTVICVCVCV